jgi:hypothetical protein
LALPGGCWYLLPLAPFPPIVAIGAVGGTGVAPLPLPIPPLPPVTLTFQALTVNPVTWALTSTTAAWAMLR